MTRAQSRMSEDVQNFGLQLNALEVACAGRTFSDEVSGLLWLIRANGYDDLMDNKVAGV